MFFFFFFLGGGWEGFEPRFMLHLFLNGLLSDQMSPTLVIPLQTVRFLLPQGETNVIVFRLSTGCLANYLLDPTSTGAQG